MYDIYYIAEDSSGNIGELIIWLYVLSEDEAPSDYPEMHDENLSEIIRRWETERNKLSVKYPSNEFDIDEYYSTLEGLSGEAFFIQLQNIIDVVQVSYGEARFIIEESDVKHSVYGSYLHGMYDSKKLVRYWDSTVTNTIDREHVWPKSYLTITEVDNPNRNIASDVHNLRAILKSTNTSRSNHYFVSGSGENGNQGSGTYYPGDDHRGDVARIMFYMHVRYNDEIYLTDDANAIEGGILDSSGRIPFGLLSVLLQWHQLDPVDDFELQRNNVIYQYQGNRNPFIDHPEYAAIIFGNN